MHTWYFEYSAECSKEQAALLHSLLIMAADTAGVNLGGGYGIWVPYLSDERDLEYQRERDREEDHGECEAYEDSL